ncbi:MAG TPA: hypothetical protein VG937_02765 [Polyangiaceae bacterium]|nr:hypothetical protein [Polyangiaceae bacterium]
MRVFSSASRAFAAQIVLVAAFQSGCSSSKPAENASPTAPRDTRIVHEDCPIDSNSAERFDANADGKADVVVVRDGNRDKCRATDLNFDGNMDSFVYFDLEGKIRRRETDYDRDGRVDEISTYRGGVIVEKLRATMLANKVDTWEYYEAGKLARSQRDSDGDDVVDQWWEYPTAGCPVIHADVNNDGRPDVGASVDYCKETGYVPPERQDFRQTESPNFQQTGSLPTELESKEAPAAAPSDANKAAPPPPPPPAAKPATAPAKSDAKSGGSK